MNQQHLGHKARLPWQRLGSINSTAVRVKAGLTSSSMGLLHVVRPTMPDRMTCKAGGKEGFIHPESPAMNDRRIRREAEEEN